MTNVYWVHMPRNISRPPPEDGNASSRIPTPEVYISNESTSKIFLRFLPKITQVYKYVQF